MKLLLLLEALCSPLPYMLRSYYPPWADQDLFENRIICLTSWPICMCDVCVLSVILPPSLNHPLLSLSDPRQVAALCTLHVLNSELLTCTIWGNELISWYSATACDRLGNLKPQRISHSSVKFVTWRRFTPGEKLQGLLPLLTVFPPSKLHQKVTGVLLMNSVINWGLTHHRWVAHVF